MEFTVTDVPDRERFEARDEAGEVAGVLTYQVTGPIIACTHTEVDPRYDAAEVGAALARAALDDARARSRTVIPLCPVLTAWLDGHPEYEKQVARSTRRVK